MHYPSLIAITAAAVSLALPSKATAQSLTELAMGSPAEQAAKLPAHKLEPASLDHQPDAGAQSVKGQGKRFDREQARSSAYKWQAASFATSEADAQAIPDQSLRIAPEQRTKSAAYKWEAAFLALSAIDAVETISCLNRATCTEHNPIWGHHPSTGKIVAAKLALGAIHFTVFKLIADHDPHTALRAAQVSAAVQGGVVLLNLHAAF
jgi:hypothetical protein